MDEEGEGLGRETELLVFLALSFVEEVSHVLVNHSGNPEHIKLAENVFFFSGNLSTISIYIFNYDSFIKIIF